MTAAGVYEIMRRGVCFAAISLIELLFLLGVVRGFRSTTVKVVTVDLAMGPRIRGEEAPEKICGDGRSIVATAVGRGRARLNVEPPAPFTATVQEIRDVLRVRAERIVYVKAEDDVPWREFIVMVGQLSGEADTISLVSDRAQSVIDCDLEPSCRRSECFHITSRLASRTITY